MKKIFLIFLLVAAVASTTNAQQKKRLSPKDSVAITTHSGIDLKITYGRPSLRNRDISSIVPYGKVWRTGANEATIFQINKDVQIAGHPLPAGKYDSTADYLRVEVPTHKAKKKVETFTIKLKKNGLVNLLWSNWDIRFKVKK